MATQTKTTETKTTEKPWRALSADEKLEKRLEAWVSSASNFNFVSEQAGKDYKARIARYIDAVTLKKTPDRVPILPGIGAGFAARYCGYTEEEMNDIDKASEVSIKCTRDFQIDQRITIRGNPFSVYEILDFTKMYSWPGHGLPEGGGGIQFNEGEYMKEDEYDALIRDPSDFWLRTYLPRIMGALEPFRTLSPLCHIIEMGSVATNVSRYGLPEVQAALGKLMEAGREALAWQQKGVPLNRKLTEMGFPDFGGGNSRAPFDALGDTLRGTRGIIRDMFRQPAKLTEALERLTPIMINMGLAGVRMGGPPVAGFPLHKGADGFMSEEHFRTFYWPTLRKVCLAWINEGLMVRMGAQGGYNSRLEIIRNDLPKGRVIWNLNTQTDLARAKEIMGDIACIQGGVAGALLHTATAEQVSAYCRNLIDTVGKGGGFILSTYAVDRNARIENVRAMIEATKKYGVYS